MKGLTLRGVLLWPILPTVALIFLVVGLSPQHDFPATVVPWVVAFYEVGILAWALWRSHRLGISLGGLFRPNRPTKDAGLVGWAVLAYFSLAIGGESFVSGLWTDLVQALGLPAPAPSATGPRTWNELPGFFLLAVVLAPVVEEFLLRGLTFQVLRRWWGLVPGLLGQAVIFGFLHDEGMVWKVVLGVFLAILALKSGSLFLNWTAHLTINLVATAFLVTGMANPPDAGVVTEDGGEWVFGLFFALGLWATYQFLRRTQEVWNPVRRSGSHRRLLWNLVRGRGRRQHLHALPAPRRFLRP